MTTLFTHGFSQMSAFAQWTLGLGSIGDTIQAQGQGISETHVPLSKLPRFRSSSLTIPRVLSHEAAPEYFGEIEGGVPEGLGWLFLLGIGESRVIARGIDLLSALHFVSQAPMEREYAIERDGEDAYRLLSGDAYGVFCLGEVLLHTHKNRIALPSEKDIVKYEMMAVDTSQTWSCIYSHPRRGPQLSYIQRVAPWRFEIRFWRDWKDTVRGEGRSTARRFDVKAEIDGTGGVVPNVEALEVMELSLDGAEMGHARYDYGRYKDGNIQNFWKDVLDRV